MLKERWIPGDKFKAYGRSFQVQSIDKGGVWTRRKPLDPPVAGEPVEGESGYFSWDDLRRHASQHETANPPHFQDR